MNVKCLITDFENSIHSWRAFIISLFSQLD